MKNHNECEIIRQKIEERIIGPAAADHSEITDHIQSCSACREYRSQLEMLHTTSTVHYALPAQERTTFSARVRTRIENKKTSRRKPVYIARPAFQIAMLLVLMLSVAFYLINTEPEPVFVVEWEDIEYIDEYSFYYNEVIIPDNGITIDLYAAALFDDDVYLGDFLYNGYFDDEIYYSIDLLSPEEIEDIIQRMEGA